MWRVTTEKPVSIYQIVTVGTSQVIQVVNNIRLKSLTDFMLNDNIYLQEEIDKMMQSTEPPSINFKIPVNADIKEIIALAEKHSMELRKLIEQSLVPKNASEEEDRMLFLTFFVYFLSYFRKNE